jgi:hypothetical protein
MFKIIARTHRQVSFVNGESFSDPAKDDLLNAMSTSAAAARAAGDAVDAPSPF